MSFVILCVHICPCRLIIGTNIPLSLMDLYFLTRVLILLNCLFDPFFNPQPNNHSHNIWTNLWINKDRVSYHIRRLSLFSSLLLLLYSLSLDFFFNLCFLHWSWWLLDLAFFGAFLSSSNRDSFSEELGEFIQTGFSDPTITWYPLPLLSFTLGLDNSFSRGSGLDGWNVNVNLGVLIRIPFTVYWVDYGLWGGCWVMG